MFYAQELAGIEVYVSVENPIETRFSRAEDSTLRAGWAACSNRWKDILKYPPGDLQTFPF